MKHCKKNKRIPRTLQKQRHITFEMSVDLHDCQNLSALQKMLILVSKKTNINKHFRNQRNSTLGKRSSIQFKNIVTSHLTCVYIFMMFRTFPHSKNNINIQKTKIKKQTLKNHHKSTPSRTIINIKVF